MFQRMLNTLFQQNALSGLFDLFESLSRPGPRQVRVLTYHKVEDIHGFQMQMDFLADHYRVVSMPDLLSACLKNKPLPPNPLLITFDDAYRNFAECAWPILKQHGFPATLFVPTAFPGQPDRVFWWDQLDYALARTLRRDPLPIPGRRIPLATQEQRARAYKWLLKFVKTLPNRQVMPFVEKICDALEVVRPVSQVLCWEELRRLSGEGVTLGAHTRTHPLLNRISASEAREEVEGSLRDLQRELNVVIPVFAYPAGAYTPAAVQVVREAGFLLAFTTRRGSNDLSSTDPLYLRRNNIGKRATKPVLRVRLLQASVDLERFQPISNG